MSAKYEKLGKYWPHCNHAVTNAEISKLINNFIMKIPAMMA